MLKMVLDQLLSLVIDVERLVTAGAENISNHERLVQVAANLRRLSDQVPALRALLPHVDAALQTAGAASAPALLNLLARMRQLRGSLARPGDIEGNMQEIEESGPWGTPLPTRDLVAEINKIRTNGTHRERIAKGKESCPADLRLIAALFDDLNGANGFLADSIADQVLPSLGTVLVSELMREPFESDDLGDLRRLVALCKLDPDVGRAAIERINPELARQL